MRRQQVGATLSSLKTLGEKFTVASVQSVLFYFSTKCCQTLNLKGPTLAGEACEDNLDVVALADLFFPIKLSKSFTDSRNNRAEEEKKL